MKYNLIETDFKGLFPFIYTSVHKMQHISILFPSMILWNTVPCPLSIHLNGLFVFFLGKFKFLSYIISLERNKKFNLMN